MVVLYMEKPCNAYMNVPCDTDYNIDGYLLIYPDKYLHIQDMYTQQSCRICNPLTIIKNDIWKHPLCN